MDIGNSLQVIGDTDSKGFGPLYIGQYGRLSRALFEKRITLPGDPSLFRAFKSSTNLDLSKISDENITTTNLSFMYGVCRDVVFDKYDEDRCPYYQIGPDFFKTLFNFSTTGNRNTPNTVRTVISCVRDSFIVRSVTYTQAQICNLAQDGSISSVIFKNKLWQRIVEHAGGERMILAMQREFRTVGRIDQQNFIQLETGFFDKYLSVEGRLPLVSATFRESKDGFRVPISLYNGEDGTVLLRKTDTFNVSDGTTCLHAMAMSPSLIEPGAFLKRTTSPITFLTKANERPMKRSLQYLYAMTPSTLLAVLLTFMVTFDNAKSTTTIEKLRVKMFTLGLNEDSNTSSLEVLSSYSFTEKNQDIGADVLKKTQVLLRNMGNYAVYPHPRSIQNYILQQTSLQQEKYLAFNLLVESLMLVANVRMSNDNEDVSMVSSSVSGVGTQILRARQKRSLTKELDFLFIHDTLLRYSQIAAGHAINRPNRVPGTSLVQIPSIQVDPSNAVEFWSSRAIVLWTKRGLDLRTYSVERLSEYFPISFLGFVPKLELREDIESVCSTTSTLFDYIESINQQHPNTNPFLYVPTMLCDDTTVIFDGVLQSYSACVSLFAQRARMGAPPYVVLPTLLGLPPIVGGDNYTLSKVRTVKFVQNSLSSIPSALNGAKLIFEQDFNQLLTNMQVMLQFLRDEEDKAFIIKHMAIMLDAFRLDQLRRSRYLNFTPQTGQVFTPDFFSVALGPKFDFFNSDKSRELVTLMLFPERKGRNVQWDRILSTILSSYDVLRYRRLPARTSIPFLEFWDDVRRMCLSSFLTMVMCYIGIQTIRPNYTPVVWNLVSFCTLMHLQSIQEALVVFSSWTVFNNKHMWGMSVLDATVACTNTVISFLSKLISNETGYFPDVREEILPFLFEKLTFIQYERSFANQNLADLLSVDNDETLPSDIIPSSLLDYFKLADDLDPISIYVCNLRLDRVPEGTVVLEALTPFDIRPILDTENTKTPWDFVLNIDRQIFSGKCKAIFETIKGSLPELTPEESNLSDLPLTTTRGNNGGEDESESGGEEPSFDLEFDDDDDQQLAANAGRKRQRDEDSRDNVNSEDEEDTEDEDIAENNDVNSTFAMLVETTRPVSVNRRKKRQRRAEEVLLSQTVDEQPDKTQEESSSPSPEPPMEQPFLALPPPDNGQYQQSLALEPLPSAAAAASSLARPTRALSPLFVDDTNVAVPERVQPIDPTPWTLERFTGTLHSVTDKLNQNVNDVSRQSKAILGAADELLKQSSDIKKDLMRTTQAVSELNKTSLILQNRVQQSNANVATSLNTAVAEVDDISKRIDLSTQASTQALERLVQKQESVTNLGLEDLATSLANDIRTNNTDIQNLVSKLDAIQETLPPELKKEYSEIIRQVRTLGNIADLGAVRSVADLERYSSVRNRSGLLLRRLILLNESAIRVRTNDKLLTDLQATLSANISQAVDAIERANAAAAAGGNVDLNALSWELQTLSNAHQSLLELQRQSEQALRSKDEIIARQEALLSQIQATAKSQEDQFNASVQELAQSNNRSTAEIIEQFKQELAAQEIRNEQTLERVIDEAREEIGRRDIETQRIINEADQVLGSAVAMAAQATATQQQQVQQITNTITSLQARLVNAQKSSLYRVDMEKLSEVDVEEMDAIYNDPKTTVALSEYVSPCILLNNETLLESWKCQGDALLRLNGACSKNLTWDSVTFIAQLLKERFFATTVANITTGSNPSLDVVGSAPSHFNALIHTILVRDTGLFSRLRKVCENLSLTAQSESQLDKNQTFDILATILLTCTQLIIKHMMGDELEVPFLGSIQSLFMNAQDDSDLVPVLEMLWEICVVYMSVCARRVQRLLHITRITGSNIEVGTINGGNIRESAILLPRRLIDITHLDTDRLYYMTLYDFQMLNQVLVKSLANIKDVMKIFDGATAFALSCMNQRSTISQDQNTGASDKLFPKNVLATDIDYSRFMLPLRDTSRPLVSYSVPEVHGSNGDLLDHLYKTVGVLPPPDTDWLVYKLKTDLPSETLKSNFESLCKSQQIMIRSLIPPLPLIKPPNKLQKPQPHSPNNNDGGTTAPIPQATVIKMPQLSIEISETFPVPSNGQTLLRDSIISNIRTAKVMRRGKKKTTNIVRDNSSLLLMGTEDLQMQDNFENDDDQEEEEVTGGGRRQRDDPLLGLGILHPAAMEAAGLLEKAIRL